jgi:hypothetical protein
MVAQVSTVTGVCGVNESLGATEVSLSDLLTVMAPVFYDRLGPSPLSLSRLRATGLRVRVHSDRDPPSVTGTRQAARRRLCPTSLAARTARTHINGPARRSFGRRSIPSRHRAGALFAVPVGRAWLRAA